MYYLLFIIFFSIAIYLLLLYLTKNHKNFKKRKLNKDYYIKTIINLLISIIFYYIIFINYTFSKHLIPNLKNIIFYFIATDTIYYWVHRIIHKTPLLKHIFHSTHHESVNLVPLDLFYINVKEHLLYLSITSLFQLFNNFNIIEYLIILFILFYHSLYTHSDIKQKFILPLFINSNYHKKHHTIGKGNYSILFNIWDEYMGTKIPNKKRRLIKKNK